MKKYVVLNVIDREIFHFIFNDIENARKKLRHDFIETLGKDEYLTDLQTIYEEMIKDGLAEISEKDEWAWITDGPGGHNYDWEIITIDCSDCINAEKNSEKENQ